MNATVIGSVVPALPRSAGRPARAVGWLPTPGLLWAALVLGLGVSLLVGYTGHLAYVAHRDTAQRIGIGGVPSAVAAARIHTLSASVNALATGALLADGERAAIQWSQYAEELERLHNALIAAALNIRSGQAERSPLLQLSNRLGEYQALIGRARALDGAAAVTAMNQAQALMVESIIPLCAELAAVSRARVTAAYAAGAVGLPQARAWLLVSGVALVLVLGLIQVLLALRFRRLINVPLLLATLAAVGLLSAARARLDDANAWLDLARDQAITGLQTLSDARTAAFDARAAQALLLLNGGAEPFGQAFAARAGEVADGLRRAKSAATDQDPAGGRRRQVSEFATTDWTRYLGLHERVLTLEREGNQRAAVALSQGSEPGQAAWAFDQVDASLQQGIAAYQDAFDEDVIQTFLWLAGYPWRLAAVLTLVPVLTLLGLGLRLRELRG